jgi:hypothetical protein
MAKVDPMIARAIDLAREAGWDIRYKDGAVVIGAPDGFNLTIGHPQSNRETLLKFKKAAQNYGLIEGPAKTPAQREAEEKMLVEEQQAKAVEEQQALARKEAETKLAEEKARKVVEDAEKLPKPPPSVGFVEPVAKVGPNVKIPVQPTPTPAVLAKKTVAPTKPRDTDGFPVFTSEMIATKDYSTFKLPNGRYFCPTCWERGDKETFKMPQGLSSHRGFKHGAFTTGADAMDPAVVEEGKLPESVVTALQLLRDEVIESLANTSDAETVRDLEAKVADLNKILGERDQKIKQLVATVGEKEEMVKTVSKERDEAKTIAEGRKTLLDNEKGRYEAEVKQAMDVVEADLKNVRSWINELAPVKAVSKIDDMLTKYLGD